MPNLVEVGTIDSYIQSLSDPRHERNSKHLLVDIAIIVCGVICDCDGSTTIHCWARQRAPWLAEHLSLSNGISFRDCIRLLLMVLRPKAFQRCFQAWIGDAITADVDASRDRVAIDGKTCRSSVL